MKKIISGSVWGLQDLKFGGSVVMRNDTGEGREFLEFESGLLLGSNEEYFLHIEFKL